MVLSDIYVIHDGAHEIEALQEMLSLMRYHSSTPSFAPNIIGKTNSTSLWNFEKLNKTCLIALLNTSSVALRGRALAT